MKRLSLIFTALLLLMLAAACSGAAASGTDDPVVLSSLTTVTQEYGSDAAALFTELEQPEFSGGAALTAADEYNAFITQRNALSGGIYNTGCEYGLDYYVKLSADDSVHCCFYRTVKAERSDSVVLSLYINESFSRQNADTGTESAYALNLDAADGSRLSLDDIAADGIDIRQFAADYIIQVLESSDRAKELYSDVEERLSALVCQDGSWFFSSTGLELICSCGSVMPNTFGTFTVTVPYSELGRVIRPDFIPDTSLDGLEPFAEGILGDDSTASVSGTVKKVTDDKIILLCGKDEFTFVLSGRDARQMAAGTEGRQVILTYYTATYEVADICLTTADGK